MPGGAKNVIPLRDLRITNVALGEELVDENGRTSVRLVYIGPSADSDEEDEEDEKDEDKDEEKDDEDEGSSDAVPTILCSLTPGKVKYIKQILKHILTGSRFLLRLNKQ